MIRPSFRAFLISGQRFFFHCRIASSSRSKARPVGRWQLHPNCRNIRQTWPGWYVTPQASPIKWATRLAVHRLVSYPSCFGSPFQTALDLLQIRRAQSRLASGTPRLLEPGSAVLRQLSRPSIHRLAVHPHPTRHRRLRQPSLQQPPRLHPPPFQRFKIPPYSKWISHAIHYTLVLI